MLPPEAAEPSPLDHALAAIHRRRPVTLIHGRDELARSELKQQLTSSDLNCVLLAPSTLAALNAGAQTVHSFFGLEPTFVRLDRIAPNSRLRTLASHADCIVIDDAPTLRADLLDAIDQSLRLAREQDAPFGGLPLLLLGDFLQLPPILTKPDTILLQQLGYESHAPFAAKSLHGLVAKIIRLHDHRKIDPELVGSLRKLRLNEDLDEVVALLNYRCYRNHRRSHDPLLLTTRLDTVDELQQRAIAKLRGPTQTYRAILTGTLAAKPNPRLPAPEQLELKPGSRVMAVKADPAQRWRRGSLGTVKRLEPDSVLVRFDHSNSTQPVEAATWQSVKHQSNPSPSRIESRVVGSYTQIPLIPAYATTIQKAQGLCISDIRIDPGTAAFSNALGYIAFATAESLDGVSLTRPLMAWDVRIHPRFIEGFEEMLERLTR
ncbi:MAG: hypothetical protein V4555_02505 [Acidobacteriota bacterium]